MARWEPEQTVTQSVLERLIDRDPQSAAEAPPTRAQSVRLLQGFGAARPGMAAQYAAHAGGGRRRTSRKWTKSVYNYGLPDMNALNWDSSRDRTRLARMVSRPSHIFEPRLRNIKVVPLDPASGSPHVMRFQIEALLDMDPAPEHISFDTILQLSSGEYQVKGDPSAG